MKILNTENNTEKIYVQMEDLMRLYNSDSVIPASIFDKVFSEPVVVDDNNRHDFVEFSDKEDVNYLKSIEWIIDCKKYMKANINKVSNEYVHVLNELNKISALYNQLSDDEKKDNEYLVSNYDYLNYKLNALRDIIQFRNGNLYIPFPQVPDCDGTVFDDSKTTGYIIQEGIVPGTLLMYKPNGDLLSGKDSAYPNMINNAISVVRIKHNDFDEGRFNYHNIYSMSDDLRYLIITYREPIKNKFLRKDEKKHESIFKKLVKRFI